MPEIPGIATALLAVGAVLFELLIRVISRRERSPQSTQTLWGRLSGSIPLTVDDWLVWPQLLATGALACGTHMIAKSAAGEALSVPLVTIAIAIVVGGFIIMPLVMRLGVYDQSGKLPPKKDPAWWLVHGLNVMALVALWGLAFLGVMK